MPTNQRTNAVRPYRFAPSPTSTIKINQCSLLNIGLALAVIFNFGWCSYQPLYVGVSQSRSALCEGTECNEIGAELCFDFTLFLSLTLWLVFSFTAPTKVGYRRMRLCLKLRLGLCPKNLLRASPETPLRALP